MCIHTKSIDGILHGTEALEQNDVPLHSRTEITDDFSVFCGEKENDIILLAINAQNVHDRLRNDKSEDDDDEDADRFLLNLAVSAADRVSCAPQTEPKESENAEYRGRSDCPECAAVPARLP